MGSEVLCCDYLTLGDGDFTFSLDLCRWVKADAILQSIIEHHKHGCQNQYRHQQKGNNEDTNRNHLDSFLVDECKIVCSGIDSLQELLHKYHDVNFTLNNIMSLNHNYQSTRNNNYFNKEKKKLSISVHHCVNAIKFPDISQKSQLQKQMQEVEPIPPLPTNCTYKQIIFNHPHLGIEDASKHSKFLSHFFHSANNYWLSCSKGGNKIGGVIHLTLVKGQVERWNCLQVAKRHGFVLLDRSDFKAPPPAGLYVQNKLSLVSSSLPFLSENICDNLFQKDHYINRFQPRRHQSGKSFASRAGGSSETLTFGRLNDEGYYAAFYLPYQKMNINTNNENNDKILYKIQQEAFECPHCNKSFSDNRARKNHIKCVHDGKDNTNKAYLFCDLCHETSKKRQFPNKEALESHKMAKHLGHISIKPDWAKGDKSKFNKKIGSSINDVIAYGSCEICDTTFLTEEDEINHYSKEFLPTNTLYYSCSRDKFNCSYCKKEFHDKRAQLQHENFCSEVKNSH